MSFAKKPVTKSMVGLGTGGVVAAGSRPPVVAAPARVPPPPPPVVAAPAPAPKPAPDSVEIKSPNPIKTTTMLPPLGSILPTLGPGPSTVGAASTPRTSQAPTSPYERFLAENAERVKPEHRIDLAKVLNRIGSHLPAAKAEQAFDALNYLCRSSAELFGRVLSEFAPEFFRAFPPVGAGRKDDHAAALADTIIHVAGFDGDPGKSAGRGLGIRESFTRLDQALAQVKSGRGSQASNTIVSSLDRVASPPKVTGAPVKAVAAPSKTVIGVVKAIATKAVAAKAVAAKAGAAKAGAAKAAPPPPPPTPQEPRPAPAKGKSLVSKLKAKLKIK